MGKNDLDLPNVAWIYDLSVSSRHTYCLGGCSVTRKTGRTSRAKELEGMLESEARAYCTDRGLRLKVARRDDSRFADCDCRRDEVCVELERGRIVVAHVFY
jgi:putative hemolysin